MTVDATPGGSVAADAGTGSTDTSATSTTGTTDTGSSTSGDQVSQDGVRTSGIADPGSPVSGFAGDQAKPNTTSTTPGKTDTPPPADAKKQGQEPAGDGKDDKAPRDIKTLPEWAQKELKDARRGEATKREAAKTAEEAKTEIESKHQQLLDGIAKVLGLAPDDDPAKQDPAELAKQLVEARDEHKAARIELAVYRAAGEHDGDPESLLDSRGFLDKALKLDPADSRFASKISDAIKAAVEANPKLRLAPVEPVARASGPSTGFSQGPTAPGAGVESMSVDDFRNLRRKGRNSG